MATLLPNVQEFRARPIAKGLSYATVRDYCDSLDLLPQVTGLDGDLKNVQRPWAVKALLSAVPPPARILEIGGGEPVISGLLAELGYDTTVVDPYDGSGNGPTEYEQYLLRFPKVKLVREYFSGEMRTQFAQNFDAIFSISVLEHLPAAALRLCFESIKANLRQGGWSIHCFDFIVAGAGDQYDIGQAHRIIAEQVRLEGVDAGHDLRATLRQLQGDLETFYLSPQGHHHWRGGRRYEDFPFRKVVSLQTVAQNRGESGRNV